MIVGLVVLVLLGAVVAGVWGASRLFGSGQPDSGEGAGGAARRIVLYALLFLLVTLGAVGLAGLLGLVLPDARDIAGTDNLELARSLAFTLIAGPLAVGLWSYLWRRIDATERASTGWPLYLAVMGFVSLVVALTALLSTGAQLVAGEWHGRTFATGVVWAGVCLWHWWMIHHATKSPVRLTDLLPVAGSAFGLLVTAGASIAILTSLLDQVLFESDVSSSTAWWEFPVQAVIWAAGGAFVWWWYWVREDARSLDTGFSDAAKVIVGSSLPVLASMGGAIVAATIGLRLLFEDVALEGVGEPLPIAIGALLVGTAVWAFHRPVLQGRATARRIATLLVAGFGLAAAASGIGVVVNATLEAFTQSLVETGRLGLLFSGLSALAVGAPIWFLNWTPTASTDDHAAFQARNVYLIGVFGASALTALISLLVIVYRVFVYVLESGNALIDDIRAPLGLVVATGLVAAYHYPVWRRDRELAATMEKPRAIQHVILVTGADPDRLRHVIIDSTGAAVTVWKRSDTHENGPTTEHLADALSHTTGKRVMVVTGPGAHLDVITLEG
jgi:hypothetical protein